MTVEDQRTENDLSLDRFPVGMRVLAVDDDPICLKVLETLLRKCQYQVETTNQAIMALKMLRENRNMFDLVISDVNMPDMDGFKLLELVGIEMDLPVIMLSAHSDTKLVMKGITHGACDYLLKPVRLEELRNIWQHVVRRKKSDPKNQCKSPGHDGAGLETGESGNGASSIGTYDQNATLNRKRKDQNDDEEEESDDGGRENEDPGSQKKPRIVWTADLHKKFVDAVQLLGYEKAFPKKILDLMNVEGLTRENVASHLQKYRQFLKRLDAAERLKASGALGVKDFSYLRMSPLNHNEFGDLRSLTQPIRLAVTDLSPSVSHAGMLGRLNSPGGLTMRGIASSTGISQPSNSLGLSNSFNTLGKFQPSPYGNQSSSLFQGFPSSLELNQFQIPHTKCSNSVGELNTSSSIPTGFAALAGFQDTKTTFGDVNNVPNSSTSALMLQGSTQLALGRAALGMQPSVIQAPSDPQSSDLGISGSSNFLDHNRCNEPWQSAVQLSTFASTALPVTQPSSRTQVPSIPSTTSEFGDTPVSFSSTSAFSTPLMDYRRDVQGQDGLIGSIVSTNNFAPRQTWEGGFNNQFGAFDSQSLDQNNAVGKKSSTLIFDRLDGCSTSVCLSNEIEQSATEIITVKPIEAELSGLGNAQDGLIPNSYESLEDILNSLVRRAVTATSCVSRIKTTQRW